jgi:hypothetical protein
MAAEVYLLALMVLPSAPLRTPQKRPNVSAAKSMFYQQLEVCV